MLTDLIRVGWNLAGQGKAGQGGAGSVRRELFGVDIQRRIFVVQYGGTSKGTSEFRNPLSLSLSLSLSLCTVCCLTDNRQTRLVHTNCLSRCPVID